MDPITEQILRLKDKQKSFTDRLTERRATFEQANQVAGGRFSAAMGSGNNLNPADVFGSLGTFQRAGQDFVEPVANDLKDVEEMLFSLEKEQYDRKPGSDQLSQKDMLDLKIKANEKGLELYQKPDGTLDVKKTDALKEGTSDIVSIVDELLNLDTNPITGAMQIGPMIPGDPSQYTNTKYEQLKGLLSLENRQKLKGSGAISDFEAKTLEKAASSLDRKLGDGDFKKVLRQIKESLGGGTTSETPKTGGANALLDKYWGK